MSDVREQLVRVVADSFPLASLTGHVEVADAILERFEVTPRPVVTDEELGRMVNYAALGAASNAHADWRGKRLRNQLTEAGLTIVRREEEKK